MLTARDDKDVAEAVCNAAASGGRLEIAGGGTKAAIGAAREAEVLSLAGLSGVIDYDPAELVLTVRPGAPLAEIEPWGEPGATIGGTVAAGVAGSRRVTMGSARDHLLGFAAISGRGDRIVAGAKVVKNVTGYDLPKLMAGSWGRLGAMTELTLKVLPRPRVTATLRARDVGLERAHAAMACALGRNADVSAAAYLQDGDLLLRVAGSRPRSTRAAPACPRTWPNTARWNAAMRRPMPHGTAR